MFKTQINQNCQIIGYHRYSTIVKFNRIHSDFNAEKLTIWLRNLINLFYYHTNSLKYHIVINMIYKTTQNW